MTLLRVNKPHFCKIKKTIRNQFSILYILQLNYIEMYRTVCWYTATYNSDTELEKYQTDIHTQVLNWSTYKSCFDKVLLTYEFSVTT